MSDDEAIRIECIHWMRDQAGFYASFTSREPKIKSSDLVDLKQLWDEIYGGTGVDAVINAMNDPTFRISKVYNDKFEKSIDALFGSLFDKFKETHDVRGLTKESHEWLHDMFLDRAKQSIGVWLSSPIQYNVVIEVRGIGAITVSAASLTSSWWTNVLIRNFAGSVAGIKQLVDVELNEGRKLGFFEKLSYKRAAERFRKEYGSECIRVQDVFTGKEYAFQRRDLIRIYG